jgi:hypothetical protein
MKPTPQGMGVVKKHRSKPGRAKELTQRFGIG